MSELPNQRSLLPIGKQWISVGCLVLIAAAGGGGIGAWQTALLHRASGADASNSDTPSDLENLFLEGGDPRAGERLFYDDQGRARCGTCHLANGRGGDTGPNLMLAARSPVQVLLDNILEPDATLTSGFISVMVTTKDGKMYMGRQHPLRDDNQLGIRLDDGKIVEVARSEIEEQRAVSAMPSDYEKTLSMQDLRDLIAFLRAQKIKLPPHQKSNSRAPEAPIFSR